MIDDRKDHPTNEGAGLEDVFSIERVASANDSKSLGLIASLVTVFGTMLTVLYADGNYEAWDGLVGGLVLYVAYAYRREFAEDQRALVVVRVGIALGGLITLATLGTLTLGPTSLRLLEANWRIFDVSFGVAAALFLAATLLYKP